MIVGLRYIFVMIFNFSCERGQKCTCWFDGWFKRDWSSCCEEHDRDYIKQRVSTKEKADKDFYKCLQKRAGKFMAWIMYTAVKRSAKSKEFWNFYKNHKQNKKG